ncbi:MAG: hypothetical protein ACI4DY_06865 [Monoglobaceae bacterium]
MRLELSKKLISAYRENEKNPNYSLSFILNSVDPGTCASGADLIDSFIISDDKDSFEIDDNSIRVLKTLFGKVDAVLVEKMLWIAFMLPEM